MDLTLECIRRHYAGGPESPLADVLTAYADFFALFDGFKEFVDFFLFQDLVTPDSEPDSVLPAVRQLHASRDTGHNGGVRDVP